MATLDGVNGRSDVGGVRRSDFLRRAAIAGAGVSGAGGLLADHALAAPKKGSAKNGRHGRGLGGQLVRLSHIWINVSDVDRSVEFYEAVAPYTRAQRINGPAQAFPGLGLKRGQFTGWVLQGTNNPDHKIFLVQWLDPAPVGVPYPEANHLGFYRTNNVMAGTGLNAAHARVVAAGGRPYGPPSQIFTNPGQSTYVFAARDPDGVTLEWSSDRLEPTPGAVDVASHVQLNTSDLPSAYAFFREVIGLVQFIRLNPTDPQPVTAGSLGDLLRLPNGEVYTGDTFEYDASIITAPAGGRFIDLLEWEQPAGVFGRPYQRPNNLGIVRISFEVVDIDASHRLLLAASRHRNGPRDVGPVETWDLGEAGVKKVVVFKNPEGVPLEVVEMPPPIGPTPA